MASATSWYLGPGSCAQPLLALGPCLWSREIAKALSSLHVGLSTLHSVTLVVKYHVLIPPQFLKDLPEPSDSLEVSIVRAWPSQTHSDRCVFPRMEDAGDLPLTLQMP